MNIHELQKNEIQFIVSIETEEVSIFDHFDSGDSSSDREMEKNIIRRLDRGDLWAWCIVIVVAKYGDISGMDHLGCCSYKDENEFRECGYYNDMCDRALEDLNKRIRKNYDEIKDLIEP